MYPDRFSEHGLAGIPHKYKMYYVIPGSPAVLSKEYDSYSTVFDKAIQFANYIACNEDLDDKTKIDVLSSLHIVDSTALNTDITTAELRNAILDIMKEIQ